MHFPSARHVPSAPMLTFLISIAGLLLSIVNSYLYVDLHPIVEFDYSTFVSIPRLERELIVSFLDRSHTMLEYGSGYSTLYFSQFVRSFYSIEHDAEWFHHVQKLIGHSPRSFASVRRHVLVRVEVGDRGWPGGTTEGNYRQFKDYILAVKELPVRSFDRVLIDGRARYNCLKEVHRYLHADSIVFVHGRFPYQFMQTVITVLYEKIFQTYGEQPITAFRPIFSRNRSSLHL